MSLNSHSSLRFVFAAALAISAAACASATPPPAAPAAPPAQAFQQASSPGATEMQAPEEGVVFVSQEHKTMPTHEDDTPVTSLHADVQATRAKH